jgi:hypothetical protein
MRVRTLLLALVVLTSIARCDGNGTQVVSLEIAESPSSALTAVNYGDAPQLRQRAAEDRRRVDQSRSDHERISAGSRANFLATLAVIADLKCRVPHAEAEEVLKLALAAARKAGATDSVYEKTRGFNEATFAATRAVELLTERLTGRRSAPLPRESSTVGPRYAASRVRRRAPRRRRQRRRHAAHAERRDSGRACGARLLVRSTGSGPRSLDRPSTTP